MGMNRHVVSPIRGVATERLLYLGDLLILRCCAFCCNRQIIFNSVHPIRPFSGLLYALSRRFGIDIPLKANVPITTILDLDVVRTYRRLQHCDSVPNIIIYLSPISAVSQSHGSHDGERCHREYSNYQSNRTNSSKHHLKFHRILLIFCLSPNGPGQGRPLTILRQAGMTHNGLH
jgi:hypothetical protein